ncbi:MAG: magnesium chelatase subunit D [Rhodoferax sp.]|nr:magnesium chelatase subunit D [Rhodoferax sp.]
MTVPEPAPDNPRWLDAQLAVLALQVDPARLGGVWLRAGHGPVRDTWLQQLNGSGIHVQKVPAQVDEDRLLGGIDLALTLQTGRIVHQSGLLAAADGGVVVLPMAERLGAQLAAQLCQAQDQGQVLPRYASGPLACRFGMVALDESDEDEAGLCAKLADRLGLWLDLRDVARAACTDAIALLDPAEVADVRRRLQSLQPEPEQINTLCEIAYALGVDSLRSIQAALRLACVHAALNGRAALDDDDLGVAARLVLGPRATRMPQSQQQEAAPPPTESADESPPAPDPPQEPPPPDKELEPSEDIAGSAGQPPQELLLAAALASLPPKLLDRLLMGKVQPRNPSALGSNGQAARSTQRGRPLAPRPGKPGGGKRLHLLATLRAAAPKQRLRTTPSGAARVAIRAEDFHVRRFEQRRPTCLIFALDASGSAAQQRLAEAKGAVELLLEQSYARRDSVCVIAFRGTQAQLLLAPTRSLVRAKRALAGLPGGGGTPLASGIQSALVQAGLIQRNGSTPMLVVLSDGRANVALSGVGGRAQAQADAQSWAGQWCGKGFASLWIDTSKQPDPQAQQLAATMGAQYFPMPYVDARRMASVVDDLRVLHRSGQ